MDSEKNQCEAQNAPSSENVEKNSNEENPYAYLDRLFSSEKYKIEIKNLPKYYGINEFRKLLNIKLKLNVNKIKTVRPNSPFAFVCFRSNEDRENALKVLSNYKWKGNLLEAMIAKPAPDPLVKKRKEHAEDSGVVKKFKTDIPQHERLKDSTIPYWNVEYKEQLRLKQEDVKNILKRLGNDLAHHNPDLRQWVDKQKATYNGLPCDLQDIRFVEQIKGYRNKCEFSVGIDEETNLPTVGFRIGSYVHGIIAVAPVEHLLHIPEPMKVAVKVFQDYVRSSNLRVFSPEHHTGHFRQLKVRSAPNQLMVVVGIHPEVLTEEEISSLKKSLVEYFTIGAGNVANITSLFYQKIVRKDREDDYISSEHLWGDTHIYDSILDYKFRISPDAFFQINTKGAEVLYQTAIELAEPNEDSTVLDVCCGSGTIGLCFAKKCGQVLGLEILPHAIVDAKENARINDVKNADFFAGKAQDILGSICFKATKKEIIAIVDPPRAGLHRKAILQLRKVPKITKVIYIACKPSAVLKNYVDLGRPESKTVHGRPFVPTKAIPVDMFPYTKHCELAICFERWNDDVSTEQGDEEMEGIKTEQGEEETKEIKGEQVGDGTKETKVEQGDKETKDSSESQEVLAGNS